MSPQQRKSTLDFLGELVLALMQPPPAVDPIPPQAAVPPEPIDDSPPDEPPIFSIDWTELEQAIKQGFEE